MLRNLLLLVEQTPSGQAAKKVACDIAGQGNCNLTALAIREPDSPAHNNEDLAASPHALSVDELAQQEHRDAWQSNAHAPAGNGYFSGLPAGWRTKVVTGPKYAVLCQELENNDLAVMGRDGNFAEHWSHNAKEVINLLLEYRPRPLIIAAPMDPGAHRDVLITYDGSAGSSRAVQFFALMGLARNRNVHVLSVSRKKNVAGHRVDLLAAYLKKHDIETLPHAVNSREDPRDVIVDMIGRTRASLVVAGAFGTSGWKRSLFGSVSDYLIRYCPVPLFACQ